MIRSLLISVIGVIAIRMDSTSPQVKSGSNTFYRWLEDETDPFYVYSKDKLQEPLSAELARCRTQALGFDIKPRENGERWYLGFADMSGDSKGIKKETTKSKNQKQDSNTNLSQMCFIGPGPANRKAGYSAEKDSFYEEVDQDYPEYLSKKLFDSTSRNNPNSINYALHFSWNPHGNLNRHFTLKLEGAHSMNTYLRENTTKNGSSTWIFGSAGVYSTTSDHTTLTLKKLDSWLKSGGPSKRYAADEKVENYVLMSQLLQKLGKALLPGFTPTWEDKSNVNSIFESSKADGEKEDSTSEKNLCDFSKAMDAKVDDELDRKLKCLKAEEQWWVVAKEQFDEARKQMMNPKTGMTTKKVIGQMNTLFQNGYQNKAIGYQNRLFRYFAIVTKTWRFGLQLADEKEEEASKELNTFSEEVCASASKKKCDSWTEKIQAFTKSAKVSSLNRKSTRAKILELEAENAEMKPKLEAEMEAEIDKHFEQCFKFYDVDLQTNVEFNSEVESSQA